MAGDLAPFPKVSSDVDSSASLLLTPEMRPSEGDELPLVDIKRLARNMPLENWCKHNLAKFCMDDLYEMLSVPSGSQLSKSDQRPKKRPKSEQENSCSIARISDAHTFRHSEFRREYILKQLPAVLEGLSRDWKAQQLWEIDLVANRLSHGNALLEVGRYSSVGMKLASYAQYADDISSKKIRDDSPLYIFEPRFGTLWPELLEDYEFPPVFVPAISSSSDSSSTPDIIPHVLHTLHQHFQLDKFMRWLLIGCERSGIPLHSDPLGTSAWNALITGRKLWAIFPPKCDEDDIDPVESRDKEAGAAYWFFRQLPLLLETNKFGELNGKIFEQRAGETVYLPAGWWHVVLNVEMTISVTQNFVDEGNLGDTLQILHNQLPDDFEEWKHNCLSSDQVRLLLDRIPECEHLFHSAS